MENGQQITPVQALDQIEQAINAAMQRGVFQNLQSATFISNCIVIVRDAINKPDKEQ